jgi:hypothetical protein
MSIASRMSTVIIGDSPTDIALRKTRFKLLLTLHTEIRPWLITVNTVRGE